MARILALCMVFIASDASIVRFPKKNLDLIKFIISNFHLIVEIWE